ncbi:hypothetical protein KIPB_013071, partial [Kipferlia bialata]
GVKLVKIDAIVVLSYILALLIVLLILASNGMDRAGKAYLEDPDSVDIQHTFMTLMMRYTHYNSMFAVLNPLGLLLLCNLSLLWDKRPAWMRRDHTTKRDTEGGEELFL